MKKFTENIILVEPNRFNLKEIELISSQIGSDKDLILSLKSDNVSKIWIWKPTGEVLFFKKKNEDNISHKKIKFNMKNIKTFKLKDDISVSPILEVNSILDKISSLGIESLTKEEKEFLKKGH